jgi:hypothetical protein
LIVEFEGLQKHASVCLKENLLPVCQYERLLDAVDCLPLEVSGLATGFVF